jgi:dinuclear metal center YbgI/SA1388 family protein
VEGIGEIKRVALAVTASLNVIERAAAWGADLLITHHGLLWNKSEAPVITGTFAKKIKLLLDREINLVSFHLPMDGHQQLGHAAQLLARLGAQWVSAFPAGPGAPVGVCGQLTGEITLGALSDLLERGQPTPVRKFITAGLDPEQVMNGPKVVIVTGGGQSYFQQARLEGAQLFVTGEISEEQWHSAWEEQIGYMALGHHFSEQFGLLALEQQLLRDFSQSQFETLWIQELGLA